MLTHDGSHHEYFEELCALAASGQISEPEFIELQDHLQECGECRSTYADFVGLVHHHLPLADPEGVGSSKFTRFFSEGSAYRERFLARARKVGIPVSFESLPGRFWSKFGPRGGIRFGYAQIATLAVAVLLVTVGVLAYSLHHVSMRYWKLAGDKAVAGGQSNQISGVNSAVQTPQKSIATSAPAETAPPPAPELPVRPGNDAELAKVRTDRKVAEERARGLEEQLQSVASEVQELRAQNQEASASREQLERKLKEAEQAANAVRDDLQAIRQARSKDSVTIAAQDLEIQKMSDRLTEQAQVLEEERALLEASRDVRDLMGARIFHIADVYEVDSKGKDQRAFGRIFTAEGNRRLIFYAFDLGDRNTEKRKAAFQVWGKHGRAQSPTHSLGLFQIDDQKQNRWVLRFEDPRVLADIDSVFVTVEPQGGSAKPTGRQFLFAYLNANPNRP